MQKKEKMRKSKILRAGQIDVFIKELGNCENVTEFSPQAFGVLVESVTVKKNGEIEYSFIDGSVVRV